MAPAPAPAPPPSITRLLVDWRRGNERALDALLPRVYDELRQLAARHMASERPDHTLQATALVHEAYARLVDADIPWEDRAHFFAVASGTMRRVLVDHARARSAEKRGGASVGVTLHEGLLADEAPADQFLQLDRALDRLASFDSRKAKVLELRYFAGLNATEIGSVLDVGVATVQRDLRAARAWLLREMSEAPAPDPEGA
jgi:RNA polymerase sigma factor (TIGR02999 family)